MLVKTQRDGSEHTGLHIGAVNAQRYFRKGTQAIDLILDHLEIQCRLSPDFWQGRPEIHDPRLSEWLEFKAGRGGAARAEMELIMVRSGIDSFVLKAKSQKKQCAFGEEPSQDIEVIWDDSFSVAPSPIRFVA